MSGTALPIDADPDTGAPAFTGQDTRVAFAALMSPSAERPLGARSGIRPGNDPTVTVDAASWTVGAFVGIADPNSALGVGPYLVAFTADETGAMNPADQANPRIDRLDVQVPDDPPGNQPRDAVIVYTAGDAAAAPVAPGAPARSFPLGQINVPPAGGGAPSFAAAWPYAVAAGGIIPNYASDTPGLYVGQYRDHPTDGLQRWNGTDWEAVTPVPYYEEVHLASQDLASKAGVQQLVNFSAPGAVLDGPLPSMFDKAAGTWTCAKAGVYTFTLSVGFVDWVSNSPLKASITRNGGSIDEALAFLATNEEGGSAAITITATKKMQVGDVVIFNATQMTGAAQTVDVSEHSYVSVLAAS